MDLSKKYTDLLIMVEFNIHYYHDYYIIHEQFQDSMQEMGLIQHVNFVSHISGNIIDLVFTEQLSKFKVTKVREGPMLSDHKMVIWNLNIDKPDTQTIWKEFHNWKKVDLDDLCNNLEFDTLNYKFLQKYENKITSKLDEKVPLIKKRVVTRDSRPWYTDRLREQKLTIRNAESKWAKCKMEHQLTAYKSEKTKYMKLLYVTKKRLP